MLAISMYSFNTSLVTWGEKLLITRVVDFMALALLLVINQRRMKSVMLSCKR